MGDRLGPKTAARSKNPPTPTPPTHGEAKANTKERQAEREAMMTQGLTDIRGGRPAQGQPARSTPKVKKRSC